jgi:putative ABC transport system permease protein
MNYAALLGSAVFALLRNKLRSVLTVLGITIGIAAVIRVVAIGKAGQMRVEQQLNSLGDNFVWIEEGDAVAIRNQIPLIKAVSPNVDGSIQIIAGNQNWYTSYRGVSPEYFDIKNRAPPSGGGSRDNAETGGLRPHYIS